MNTFDTYKFGKQLLRFTFIAVFTYFALSQFLTPDEWTTFVPHFLATSDSVARMLVHANAVFESIAVILLAVDRGVKWVTLLLALHLFGIASTIGLNPVGVRDFGLALSVPSLTFLEWRENRIV